MTDPTNILGAKKYCMLVDESAWGTFPGMPTYYHLPVQDYGVRFNPVNRQAKRFVGLMQPKHNRNYKGMPQGALQCGLHGYYNAGLDKSLAQLMLEWAFASHESKTPQSKSIEAYEENLANKRHTGLRVNSATLQGSEDSGVLELNLDLQGKAEFGDDVVTASQALPTDLNRIIDFEFPDIVFELGESEIPIGGFSWQVQTGLKVKYLNGRTPYWIQKTQHIETLTITPPKSSDTWDAFRREVVDMVETEGVLTIKGLHMGTGDADTNWNQCVIEWPRLSLVTVAEEGGMEDLAMQPLTFLCAKPDTSDNCSTMTWSDEA